MLPAQKENQYKVPEKTDKCEFKMPSLFNQKALDFAERLPVSMEMGTDLAALGIRKSCDHIAERRQTLVDLLALHRRLCASLNNADIL